MRTVEIKREPLDDGNFVDENGIVMYLYEDGNIADVRFPSSMAWAREFKRLWIDDGISPE